MNWMPLYMRNKLGALPLKTISSVARPAPVASLSTDWLLALGPHGCHSNPYDEVEESLRNFPHPGRC